MNDLLAGPILEHLAAAAREHLDGKNGHAFVGNINERELAAALLPAVAAHTVEVLDMLAAQHEQRAAAMVGDSRAANNLRAAHEDAARTARKFAELYASATTEAP